MKKNIKQYIPFFILVSINLSLFFINKDVALKSIQNTSSNFLEMIQVLPPIFILLGLFDVWVPREVLVKFMGEGSGLLGILIAFFLGSFTAGPLYAAFPFALVLMKKGSTFTNILIFIGAWSTTKIPMLLFEISSLGLKFAITRLIMDIFGILMISYLIKVIIGEKEKKAIYENAATME